MTTVTELAERLASMVGEVPEATEIVELAPAEPQTSERRTTALLAAFAEVADIDVTGGKRRSTEARTVMHLPGGGRAVTFTASGAMIIRAGIEPFAELYPSDPGDDRLKESMEEISGKLGLAGLLPEDDALDFEHLWRIKAAGGDAEGSRSDPLFCRAVGAYRHRVRGLPVLGRASATVELTGKGRPASITVSARRFAGDGGGTTIDKVESRPAGDAARDVAERIARALRGTQEPRLEPHSFQFGYLSLSRRRPQSLLAPVYVAALTVEGDETQERSAHVIAVPGSAQAFLRLPGGVPAAGQPRPPRSNPGITCR
jgi:hypothetical protein